jgi:hypothetical protein
VAEAVTDLAIRVKAARTAQDASRAFPGILAGLRSLDRSVRRLPPRDRHSGDVALAIDWLRQAIVEAPLPDGQRGALDAAVCELVELVGPDPAKR